MTRDRLSDPSFGEPSLFWERLAAEHAADLERYGVESVKRRQALRYFTWGWHWRSLRRSRQMRFLLRHSAPSSLARALGAATDLSDEAWEGVVWPRRDRWLYAFASRLLWDYAARHDASNVLSLPEPELGRPLPVRWRGRLISQDLANSALEVTAITRALGDAAPRSILEVGAGYGRTAYALLNAFPRATYTVVDIEPALSIAQWYLTQLFAADRLRFVHPAEIGSLSAGSADLVVSISSLHEMTIAQLEGYLDLFDALAEGGVVYLKQWQRWTNPIDGITVEFDRYPIPSRWRRKFAESAPVQSNFRQAAWDVPA
jgi:putative sugar O-methyltransferase